MLAYLCWYWNFCDPEVKHFVTLVFMPLLLAVCCWLSGSQGIQIVKTCCDYLSPLFLESLTLQQTAASVQNNLAIDRIATAQPVGVKIPGLTSQKCRHLCNVCLVIPATTEDFSVSAFLRLISHLALTTFVFFSFFLDFVTWSQSVCAHTTLISAS